MLSIKLPINQLWHSLHKLKIFSYLGTLNKSKMMYYQNNSLFPKTQRNSYNLTKQWLQNLSVMSERNIQRRKSWTVKIVS